MCFVYKWPVYVASYLSMPNTFCNSRNVSLIKQFLKKKNNLALGSHTCDVKSIKFSNEITTCKLMTAAAQKNQKKNSQKLM